MQDKQALYDEFLPLLIEPKRDYDGLRQWSFCPCHSDGEKHGRRGAGLQGRSLSLHPTIGLGCFAGCKFEDITKALRNGHARPPTPPPQGRDHLVAIYDYVGPDGKLVAQKGRWEGPDGKRFAWRLPGSEKWDGLGQGGMLKTPLYGTDDLALAPPERPVYYVEGEKAMEACVEHKLLATTHGGGSGTRDFGDSLEILRGRTVRLWPDNDAVGREYMGVVAARLRGIAKAVSFVTCPIPLPEKGDAFDYFAKGGTAEALEKGQPLTEPMVEYLPDDGLRVSIPTAGGPAIFTFTEWEVGARNIEAALSISYGVHEPYEQRVNLRSSSQRTELRRTLDDFYGKDCGWVQILNTAYTLASSTFTGLDRSRHPDDIVLAEGAMQWVVENLIPKGAPTIAFGDGGSGKSYLADGISIAVAAGLPIAGLATRAAPVLYVDWEDNEQNWRRRIDRVAKGMGLAQLPRGLWYWDAQGIPLVQQFTALKHKVQKDGIGLIVIDSAALACGGDPLKPELVIAFFSVLKRLAVDTLIIAHITKAGETMKPFGFVGWHNAPRRTWYVAKSDDEGDTLHLGLVCRKSNDGIWPKPIPIEIHFDGEAGAVTIKRGDRSTMPDTARKSLSQHARLQDALRHGGKTLEELAEDLGEKPASLTVVLNRYKKTYQRIGNQWGLLSNETTI